MDGDTIQERLGGVWPKNEDWHGIRIACQVTYKYLYLFSNPCQERGGICNMMQHLKNKQSLSQQIELLLLLTLGNFCFLSVFPWFQPHPIP